MKPNKMHLTVQFFACPHFLLLEGGSMRLTSYNPHPTLCQAELKCLNNQIKFLHIPISFSISHKFKPRNPQYKKQTPLPEDLNMLDTHSTIRSQQAQKRKQDQSLIRQQENCPRRLVNNAKKFQLSKDANSEISYFFLLYVLSTT